MRFLIICLAASAVFAADAHAQVRVRSDIAAALARPLPVAIDGQIHTARPREAIFEQQAVVSEVVRLQAPVSAAFPLGRTQVDLSLPARAELFRVALHEAPDLRAFCSADTVRTDVGPQRPARVGRACLSDDDNDGRFDRVWYMYVPISAGGRTDGTWEIYPFTRIAGGLLYSVEDEHLAAPVAYAAAPTHSIAPMTLAIVYVTWGSGVAFQLNSREGEALTVIGTEVTGASPIDAANEYPKLLTFMGAEIEILSRADDGSISYRVRRGFAEDKPLQLENVPPPSPPPPSAPRRN